jgi:lipoyl(octanoyl) transferase
LGLRVREGISTHGLSLNLGVSLAPFSWMNPCGQAGLLVTSVEA